MLVPLDSPEGKRRLKEATGDAGRDNRNKNSVLHKEVVDSFRKQRGNTVCGLASLAVLLTARKKSLPTSSSKITKARPFGLFLPEGKKKNKLPPAISPQDDCFVDEDDVYPMAIQHQPQNYDNGSSTKDDSNPNSDVVASCIASNCSVDIVSEEKIRTCGMTLDQVRALAEALPTTDKAIALFPSISIDDDLVDTRKGNENEKRRVEATGSEVRSKMESEADLARAANDKQQVLKSPQHLRKIVRNILSENSSGETGLVLNYHMTTLGQDPYGGHLSPVAALHGPSDSLLVMDVWHTQTEPVWVPIDRVWTAISVIDLESQKPRGLLLVIHRSCSTLTVGGS